MASSNEVSARFPDDTGVAAFAREYPTAVAPAEREYLATRPPLFVLWVPGDETLYDERVRRVVGALQDPLDDRGKLVPYAVVEAGAGGELLADEVGGRLTFDIPRNLTPDRFAHFSLLRDVVTEIVGSQVAPGAKALRDSAYQKRVKRGGLPEFLWAIGGGDKPPVAGTYYSWLLSLVWLPVTRTFPRWWWAGRQTRKLIRPAWWSLRRKPRWLGAELHLEKSKESLFRVLDEVAQQQVSRLAPAQEHPRRQEALLTMDLLLVRALLEDLSVPSIGGVLPKRRRRTARPVVLIGLPAADGEGAAAARPAERFLTAFHHARRSGPASGPLVIAVGRPSDALLRDLGGPEETDLVHAAAQLRRPQDDVVLVKLNEEAFAPPGVPIQRAKRTRFKVGWRTATSLMAGGTSLALLVLGVGVIRIFPVSPASCVGGNDPVGDAAQAAQSTAMPFTRWYDTAYNLIRQQNKEADGFAAQGRTVRTIVYFGSARPSNDRSTLFDGTIPELRGIAMWQRSLLTQAVSDNTIVPLRVDVRETGPAFQGAVHQANRLVTEVKSGKDKGDRQVVGVLGYAQSRDTTQAALKILTAAHLPVVGTTATADEMLNSDTNAYYWPLTPQNSAEARIEAAFASTSPIVAGPGDDGCRTAQQAIVIESPADLYSNSLARDFVDNFPGAHRIIGFQQDRSSGSSDIPVYTNPSDVATQVCAALQLQPDSIVYWSARARDFEAFVNALDTQGLCTGHDVTVLGGNELTNMSQTGMFQGKTWLRLYYSAHRLPDTDPHASKQTTRFVADYEALFGGTGKTPDPWLQDGHSAVAYDAFHVFSDAAKKANAHHSMDSIASYVGVAPFNGATGYVQYPTGMSVNSAPVDKALILLRQTAHGPVVVAACGAYGAYQPDQSGQPGQSSGQQGSPCSS